MLTFLSCQLSVESEDVVAYVLACVPMFTVLNKTKKGIVKQVNRLLLCVLFIFVIQNTNYV